MFNKLFNFAYQRTWVQALVFYVTYYIIAFALAYLLERISGIPVKTSGATIALAFTFILSLLIVLTKKQQKSILYVSIAIVGCVAAGYKGGIWAGLLFPAYLSTIPVHQDNNAAPISPASTDEATPQ